MEVPCLKNIYTDSHILGAKIFLSRHQQGISLRTLAKKAGLSYSHLNRIEKNKTNPKPEKIDLILKTLDCSMIENKTWDTWFIESFLPEIYSNIYYGQYDKSKSMFKQLHQYHDYYANSKHFIDYYLVVFATIVHTLIAYDKIDFYLKTCQLLKPFMNTEQQEILILNQAHYYMFNKAFDVAQNYLIPNLKSFNNPHIKARAYYLMGLSITNDYTQYNQAMDYYEKAKAIFDETMNFERSHRTKTMQLRLYAYLQRKEEFYDILADVSEYAISHQSGNMYSLIQVHLALAHVMNEQYQDALDVLSLFTMEEGVYYFLKVYAYMRLDRSLEALKTIQKTKQCSTMFEYKLEAQGMRVFERILTHKANKKTMDVLKQYCDQAHQEKDLLMIQVATHLYVEALKAKRAYKEAYIYTNKYLQVLYRIVH